MAGRQRPTRLRPVDLADLRHHPLLALISEANKSLADAGFPVCPVEPQWLHITIDQVTGRTASQVPTEERRALVDALRERMADVAPLELTVGSLLSYHSGVIADLHPDGSLAELHATIRHTIRAICGEEAARYPWGVQHLTAAYAYDHADSDAALLVVSSGSPLTATWWGVIWPQMSRRAVADSRQFGNARRGVLLDLPLPSTWGAILEARRCRGVDEAVEATSEHAGADGRRGQGCTGSDRLPSSRRFC
ncbi:2'-5' RNA ligase family protein [Streptomyces sp. NPDC048650]|uniref:2'-5' RNA ligase family protein n=1 Tax=Streptomyces sp. NPDC048650 TaxID=3365583 RepID=UPI00371C1FF6